MKTAMTAFLALGMIVTAHLPALAEGKGFTQFPNIVDFAFVQEHAGIPRRPDVTIVDARPARKFSKGHVPVAINISFSVLEKNLDKLPEDKASRLIFYCGGLRCPLSHKSAFRAQELGYQDVHVYAEGYPDWVAKGGLPGVSADYTKAAVEKGTALPVDARPPRKFDKGHVPGAINVATTRFDDHANRLPEDKNAELLFYCGGYHCPLSPKGAAKAKALGYTNIKLFQAGYPGWKKAFGAAETAAPKAETVAQADGDQATKKEAQAGDKGADTPLTLEALADFIRGNPDKVRLIDSREAGTGQDDFMAVVVVVSADAPMPAAAAAAEGGETAFAIQEGEGGEGSVSIAAFNNILAHHSDKVHIIDVRDQGEVDIDGTFASARVLPVHALEPEIPNLPNDKPIIFFCANGSRAAEAYDFVTLNREDIQAYYLDASVQFSQNPLPTVTSLN